MLNESILGADCMISKYSFLKLFLNYQFPKRSISDSSKSQRNDDKENHIKHVSLNSKEVNRIKKIFALKRSLSDPQKKRNTNQSENVCYLPTIKPNLHEKIDNKNEEESDVNKSLRFNDSIKNDVKTDVEIISLLNNSTQIISNAQKSIQITLSPNKEMKMISKSANINNLKEENVYKITRASQSKEHKIKIICKNELNNNNTSNLQQQQNSMKNKSFNIMMPIEKEPICIAISDINGDINKLQSICKFIKVNPQFSFVFIGGILRYILDGSNHEENWSCISMIVNEFLQDDTKYILDNETKVNYSNNDKVISLPSEFKTINFVEKKYDDIENRIKFIACDSEYEYLSLFQKNYHKVNSKYVFQNKKLIEQVSFEQLCLIYRYLSNCNSVIVFENEYSSFAHSSTSHDTLYFRQHNVYNNNIPLEIGGLDENDNQMTLISLDEETGFSVEGVSLPFKFIKSSIRYSFDKI